MKVGFIGLGNMGWPMARRLHQAGHELRCYDAVDAARSRAAAAGLPVVAEALHAARDVDALLLMLPSSDVVEAVLLDGGVLVAMPPSATVVDMGSSRPASTRSLAEAAAARGVRYVDAPVSGGVLGAEAGSLTIMAGGEGEDVTALQGLLSLLGGRITHVGPAGAGHALKALNNLMSATHLLVSSEALLVGQAFGLDFEVMLDAVNTSSGRSGSTEVKWPKYVLPGTYDSGFGMALMVKDMTIAVDLANELDTPSPLSAAALDLWRDAVADLPTGADHTAIVQWLRSQHRPEPAPSSDNQTIR